MHKKNKLLWLEQILQERFGHHFHLSQDNKNYILSSSSHTQGSIIFEKNISFTEPHSNGPCCTWDAKKEGWCSVLGSALPAPNIAFLPEKAIVKSDGGYIIHYDILGLAYWMLNRIEEIGRTDLDDHQRFPATSSHAYKHNYLERPVVDEWLHILGQVIQKTWPDLELKKHQFKMRVSHDVDTPIMYGFKSWKKIIRILGGHILKRKDLSSFFQTISLKVRAKNKLPSNDPYNTFDWIMDLSEKNGLISSFYFISGGSSEKDADYKIEDPRIRKLLRRIHDRGHEIGLHPSYNTFQNPDLIKKEANSLFSVCKEEGITQPQWGGRMHYLRWEHPTTLQAWEEAHLSYDSTLGYADRPGFRCGTCFEYQAFNPLTDKILNLRIRPLIVMECSIIDSLYLNLGTEIKALDKFLSLKKICEKTNGQFTLLWHNSSFTQLNTKKLYHSIIKE